MTNMAGMFFNASAFNQPFCSWVSLSPNWELPEGNTANMLVGTAVDDNSCVSD